MIVDKRITQQIFGCLLKHPQYLGESDKYYLTPNDFQSRFEKFLFSAIWELYSQGAKKISAFDVENCLSTNETAKNSFETNNGIEYLLLLICALGFLPLFAYVLSKVLSI